uniref:Reverse transcriptase domain-containing protein n=1 Tax=Oryzias latipes TaxID=8090 RepID=A0A3P9M3I3_ORYLA
MDEIKKKYANVILTKLNQELHESLLQMPNNKAPGTEGFQAEFYKEFLDVLAPVFYRIVIFVKDHQSLPANLNSANIILLLKPEKDPTMTSSYRPISLINAQTMLEDLFI